MPPLMRLNGKPTFLLGVNYWSRAGGPRMWERFDETAVRRELAQMRSIGLNVCRSFTFLPTFMPAPPQVSGAALARLQRFFELCSEERMSTIPSLLVGHMSGENFDFPEQAGRSPYSDPEVLAWQRALFRAVGEIGAAQPAVAAYLASNEMPLWGGRADVATVVAWARFLRQALHERDSGRPFSLGDGVMNLKGGQNGFDVRALRDQIDFVGPHTYYTDSDPMRQALNAEFCVRSLTYLGLPVLFEELGGSSTQMSEENQILYYREAIHGCLGAGAAGALGWCFSDFALSDELPYRHHAFELGFGITRADGSEKPVCGELRAISRFIAALDLESFRPPQPEAAIIVPSYFNTVYPFSWEDRDRMRRTLLQAYVLCTQAGIEAELVPEGTDLSAYRLLLLPSTQKLLAPTWQELLRQAQRGATLYWSYFSGDNAFHQGAWCQIFTELTGCRHRLRYGCYDLPPADARIDGPDISVAYSTLTGGPPYPRAILPFESAGAELLARDGAGEPALARTRHGSGQVVLLNAPLEHYLSTQSDVNESGEAHQLYRLLSRMAGIRPTACSGSPVVQARVAGLATGGELLFACNHAWRPVEVRLETKAGQPLHGSEVSLPDGGATIELEPKQVAVWRLG